MKSAVFVLSLAFVASGCFLFKSNRDVYNEAKPKADELREKLVAAAKLVAKHEEPTEDDACSEDKSLVYDPKSDAHNTDYIMLNEARRGGAEANDEIPKDDPDLIFLGPFVDLMRGTGPDYYSDFVMGKMASSETKKSVKRGLNVKHVVIVRARIGEMDYFLVDLGKKKPEIVCGGTFDALPDPDAAGPSTKEYVKTTKNKKTGKVISTEKITVNSDPKGASLFVNARNKLAERMRDDLGLAFPK